MPNALNVLKSNQALDSVSMRHILSLAADYCKKSTSTFVQEMQFRLQATLDIYGASGDAFSASFPHSMHGRMSVSESGGRPWQVKCT